MRSVILVLALLIVTILADGSIAGSPTSLLNNGESGDHQNSTDETIFEMVDRFTSDNLIYVVPVVVFLVFCVMLSVGLMIGMVMT